ncbi:XdhC family protein [Pseudohongiella spirulinae]|uniref:XdhC/CoxI family protein n=1 Tax=Pseudohongiella spirulinae TaxID=1249552 RepID=A0A0S2KCI4_9GAMM|nr:XdhC family protein [Pseudohongiella spirulinae]ALO46010.1 XdhC/CoxI family protein [Pseudohongiella spirulinae]
MLSSQHHIINRVAQWLREDKTVWLCTILKTWGSSPRPEGAMMACTLDGELIGSISGGCIEEDFLQQLRDGSLKERYLDDRRPFIVHYGVSAEEQARLRLPCGGQLHVLVEYLEPHEANRAVFNEIDSALNNHQRISRLVDLHSGRVSTREQSSDDAVVFDDKTMLHSLSPRYKLLLLGAGDVARHVAELALAMDYEVTLCDPRPSYLDNWQVDGVKTSPDLPDDLVRDQFSDAYSGIVALAHDPRVDDMALMEALQTPAFYVGAMGSDRTSASRRQRLPELGLNEEQISRLHAPIGLQIGSKTPAEIAISILAEITAVRHQS